MSIRQSFSIYFVKWFSIISICRGSSDESLERPFFFVCRSISNNFILVMKYCVNRLYLRIITGEQ